MCFLYLLCHDTKFALELGEQDLRAVLITKMTSITESKMDSKNSGQRIHIETSACTYLEKVSVNGQAAGFQRFQEYVCKKQITNSQPTDWQMGNIYAIVFACMDALFTHPELRGITPWGCPSHDAAVTCE